MSPPLSSDDVHADAVWYYLTSQTGVPMPLARKGWRAIAASPSGLSIRYAFLRALDVGPCGSQARHEAAQALLDGAGNPQHLFDVLEACVQESRLSRRDATAIEDIFLRAVSHAGAWR